MYAALVDPLAQQATAPAAAHSPRWLAPEAAHHRQSPDSFGANVTTRACLCKPTPAHLRELPACAEKTHQMPRPSRRLEG
eukprot:9241148-Pyramimonas_sp.AAC.1